MDIIDYGPEKLKNFGEKFHFWVLTHEMLRDEHKIIAKIIYC